MATFSSHPGRRPSAPPAAGRPTGRVWATLQAETIRWDGEVLIVGGAQDLPAYLVLTNERLALVVNGAIALEAPFEWLRPSPQLAAENGIRLYIAPEGTTDTPDPILLRARDGRGAAADLVASATLDQKDLLRLQIPKWREKIGAAPAMALPSLADDDEEPVARPRAAWPPVEHEGVATPAKPRPRPEAKPQGRPLQPLAERQRQARAAAAPGPVPMGQSRTARAQGTEPDGQTISDRAHPSPVVPVPQRSRGHQVAAWTFRAAILLILLGTIGYFGRDRLAISMDDLRDRIPADIQRSLGIEDEPATDIAINDAPLNGEGTGDGTNGAAQPTAAPEIAVEPTVTVEPEPSETPDPDLDPTENVGGTTTELPPTTSANTEGGDNQIQQPTEAPAPEPTEAPVIPTEPPVIPTEEPAPEPTEPPVVPTEAPVIPTEEPVVPTEEPVVPTPEPTLEPTLEPTPEPTLEPTPEPTVAPTEAPTEEPTPEPTIAPTEAPVDTETDTGTETSTETGTTTETETDVETDTETETTTETTTDTQTPDVTAPEPTAAPTEEPVEAQEPEPTPTLEPQAPSVEPETTPEQAVVSDGFRYTIEGASVGETVPELPDVNSVGGYGEWVVLSIYGQNLSTEAQVFDMADFRLWADGQEVLVDVGNAWVSGLLGNTPAYGNTDAIQWAPGEAHQFTLTFLAPPAAESLVLQAGDQTIDLSPALAEPEPLLGEAAPVESELWEAQVVEVIDGETIVVEIDGVQQAVRYLSLDVPTGDACYAAEATEANRALVEGQTVLLERQATNVDARGNWVRDVWVMNEDGVPVLASQQLVLAGAAEASVSDPNTRYTGWLESSEAAARDAGAGKWSECGE